MKAKILSVLTYPILALLTVGSVALGPKSRSGDMARPRRNYGRALREHPMHHQDTILIALFLSLK